MTTIYYDYLMQDDQKIIVAATDHGICFVGSPNQPLSELTTFMPNHDLLQDPAKLAPVIDQITAYLTHARTTWDLPFDFLVGTPFQQQVWTALQTIPYGQTVTYNQLATQIGRPTAIRAVASAVGRNPLLMIVPCHRVIRKDGSLGGYRGGLPFKKQLLALEQ
ncbi:methylated-DNA--[protein]-cysteine S-methyltransferase [Latilactobacillus sakei]|jgi:methylated-DNA-[protein]-cysteine S-methyltransferase|uniref:methylated-DNA--[protein]-cysteine S-methyltransferase n=1 Tax=Latilactobacillus sakei TaxID=1599 RepID=A0AAE8LX30_LATSK|nr:methylated-DNA--[protein]-cysteine S-methyltransferase [Latilactobacillus sakei]ARJ72002.1 cysteine methyltransferase [Latilactobacillus sakei]EOR84049.1 methylated-DNA--protein-cysteine methyltransferase [Latilactobacillus sakei subsp. sakei LS25]MCB4410136.1 methylated-DNA--[protein]-cysteine S-methyltransferase [Latilactobacillus sakei]MDH0601516.1 methylated-DNA--[protein]-cysteine S-methyltransferase [Latilactobacillus sakei]MDR7924850.1 methylated-DNA--[protein]-cysteine S-methyltrans